MTGKTGLDLESFGSFAEDWSTWRKLAAGLPSSVPGSELLRAVTGERSTWELLLSSMAYVLVGPQAQEEGYLPEIGMQDRLTGLALELSASDVSPPPLGFAEVTEKVATLPYSELLEKAPFLRVVLEGTTRTALSGSLLFMYCRKKYPDDRAGFERCLITGN